MSDRATTFIALAVGGIVATGLAVVGFRRPDGPADIKCGPGRLLTVSAQWQGGNLHIPESVLALEARELRDCELDGQPVAVPRADGGIR